MKRHRVTKIEEHTDLRTGELITIQKTFTVKAATSEDFYMTFLSGLNAICELSRPSDIKVLAILCSRAEYNTGIVKLSSAARKGIMQRLECSTSAFSNSLNRLKHSGLITGERGDFEINPHCFWKGTTDERRKLLESKSADLLVKYRGDEFYEQV